MLSSFVASHSKSGTPYIITAAWVVTLAVSALPTILWNQFGGAPDWFLPAKFAFLLIALAVTFAGALVSLRPYLLILLVLFAADAVFAWIGATAFWQTLFPHSAGFVTDMLGVQLLRFAVALVMIGALFVLERHRQNFFMTRGEWNASAAPIPVLMSSPTTWQKLGPVLALCISGGTLVFLLLAAQGPGAWLGVLPILPAVLLFAAMNAFSEEISYRASFLATVTNAVGKRHALLLTSAFFGLGHYYGVPYGVIGVAMAGVLGWLLGKSMLETKGMGWAWLIHFLQDVLIFSFMAFGSVVPGGS